MNDFLILPEKPTSQKAKTRSRKVTLFFPPAPTKLEIGRRSPVVTWIATPPSEERNHDQNRELNFLFHVKLSHYRLSLPAL